MKKKTFLRLCFISWGLQTKMIEFQYTSDSLPPQFVILDKFTSLLSTIRISHVHNYVRLYFSGLGRAYLFSRTTDRDTSDWVTNVKINPRASRSIGIPNFMMLLDRVPTYSPIYKHTKNYAEIISSNRKLWNNDVRIATWNNWNLFRWEISKKWVKHLLFFLLELPYNSLTTLISASSSSSRTRVTRIHIIYLKIKIITYEFILCT